jgi:DNA-binding response OmpR family regulator
MTVSNTSQAIEPDAGSPAPQKSPPHRILVVDDDCDMRQFNVEVLVQSGYHVDAAKDGAVAWALLQEANYDLLVTDNDMPKVSGIELLKTLHAARRALPVIMATGAFPQDEFTRHPGIQPAAIIIKPYTVEKFLGTVKEVLLTTGTRTQAQSMPNEERPASSYASETTMITYRGIQL